MPKNWKLKPEVPKEICEKIPEFSTLAAQLLYNRGLTDKEQIQKFIDPKYEDQNDPHLFKDMRKAVDRIWTAIENNEGICIYGDYDADAVTANSVVQLAFLHLGVKVGSYIPDRFTEGYGLNIQAFETIRDQGCKVVITVDCGTNSTEVAEFCNRHNIDLIITDHHEIIGELPKAYALINPKNPNDSYPYHEITGVGVAFKLMKAVLGEKEKIESFLSLQNSSAVIPAEEGIQKGSMDPGSESGMTQQDKVAYVDGYEKWLLDLVAIGTVADCHSLMGENRILVKYGLKVLTKTKWVGLRAIANVAKLDFSQRPPDTYTLGFVIAPRLNAAGRLEHADQALHTVLEQDPQKAMELAQNLESINQRRQDQTLRIMSEAREQAEKFRDRKVLVLAGEGWNKGIVGLVAGRLVEEFHKPVLVLEKGEHEATGSARTIGEFNVVEALKHASEYLIRFGGHQQAAGLTLKTKDLEKFYEKILEYAELNLQEEDKVLELDAELKVADLNLDTLKLVTAMEPFGVDNVKPKFLIQNTQVISSKIVGRELQHLQLKLSVGGKELDSILFSASDFAKNLQIGDTVDVAAELLEDTWNGRQKLKLRIIDIRTHVNI